jgi:hypothetical protein
MMDLELFAALENLTSDRAVFERPLVLAFKLGFSIVCSWPALAETAAEQPTIE